MLVRRVSVEARLDVNHAGLSETKTCSKVVDYSVQ
jgi:hypothetical protein